MIYAADEFLAALLSEDAALSALVGGAVYRFRDGLVPTKHPHVLIRRAPENEVARHVARGVFTCTAVVVPSRIPADNRPAELIAKPIAQAILDCLGRFEDDELPPDLESSASVWGGQILVPDYSMSYSIGGDTPAASPSTLELGATIRVWSA